ncbi:MAG: c-type cytochrome domain-containing protein [Ignavibacteria bacterium]
MRHNLLMPVIFALVIFYAGCRDSVTESDIRNRTIPSASVSYNKDIQPVLELYCNHSGCHDDGSRAGGLSFTSYLNTTSDATVVVKGFPENSRLIWVITPGASNPMPPFMNAQLTPNMIAGITTWIKEGAKPN